MTKAETLKRIEEIGVIPVVRAASAEEAVAVAEAIGEGGIPVLEITMTVPGAVTVISELSKRYGNQVLVGAGTVLDPEAAGNCINAGAQFVVSPSLNIFTIELCNREGIAVFPGSLTPTEVVTAWQAGADAVKVFPCSAVGGPKYLRALKAPLPQVRLVPTGGVSLSTAAEFIAAGAWALGVGADLVNTAAIRSGDRGSVVNAARGYVEAVREARVTRFVSGNLSLVFCVTVTASDTVIGVGSAESSLSTVDLRAIVEEALVDVRPGERVLAIIPDRTRDDNTDLLFPLAAQFLAQRNVAEFDALVAQGTHGPMTEAQKLAKVGAPGAEIPGLGRIFDHRWNSPEELVTLGHLSSSVVKELSDGLIDEPVDVRLNALLAPGIYDTILVFGATMPHEVAGFAGGAKYFFPGVAGPELTHMTHWLGALATIEHVIGRVETPTRRVIEAAAALVPAEVISFTSVNTRDVDGLRTHALFAGDISETFRAAAAISAEVHIKYTGRKYPKVLALLDEHYDELWVGGKASYKLGSVIEEGGELIIYAPHLNNFSATHGRLIEKYGYAPLEIVREMVEYSDELRANLCVAAHLAHVSYGSSLNNQGKVTPRYRITLASAVPEEVCRRVNLGFLDWRSVRREQYEKDPDTLVVENAGRDLYLVEPLG